MTYAMNGAVGIVAAAVLSVLLFRERPTRWWWGIIAFGVAAVALGAVTPRVPLPSLLGSVPRRSSAHCRADLAVAAAPV